MTEKEMRESIRKVAYETGWLFYFTWSSIHSPRGLPDLIMVRDAMVLCWELKSEKGTVSDKQAMWLEALAKVPGVDARVVRPGDLENAYQALITGEWPE